MTNHPAWLCCSIVAIALFSLIAYGIQKIESSIHHLLRSVPSAANPSFPNPYDFKYIPSWLVLDQEVKMCVASHLYWNKPIFSPKHSNSESSEQFSLLMALGKFSFSLTVGDFKNVLYYGYLCQERYNIEKESEEKAKRNEKFWHLLNQMQSDDRRNKNESRTKYHKWVSGSQVDGLQPL